MKRIILLFLSLIILFSLFSCKKKDERQKFDAYYFDWFDTATVITGYASSREEFDSVTAEIKEVFDKCHRLYDIYTRYEGVNNILTVNYAKNDQHETVKVDKEIIDLIKFSFEMYELTDGKFNIAMGSVLKTWHNYREKGLSDPENAALPPMESLLEASEHTSIEDIILNEENSTVFLSDGKMSLDVGAVAKGYACEMAAQRLIDMGVSGYLINAGGNIRTIGTKPNGSGWGVGIENPDLSDTENPYIAKLSLSGQSLVTSGSYQRFYKVDGKNYHHIIDPETLMPSERYLSVSVLCTDSGLGDALSTALFNMDYEQGASLVASLDNVEALWVLPSGEILTSEGFHDYDLK